MLRIRGAIPLACWLLGSVVIATEASSTETPNILLLITDQHAATALSCTGNRDVATPTLDRLGAAHIRCELPYVKAQ